ncbi:MAG: rhodanese-like domain-containing protein [Melioribacteraceae bacterium]|nr:rhodanese-like domain-containing protein [Melioribacteraceae bacterium]
MKNYIMNLSGSKKLAIVGLILGLVAVLLGNPYDNTYAKVNVKELSVEAIRDSEIINVKELADWIIEGRVDYRLVDLRDEEAFKEYFIPTAVNIQTSKLLESNLMRNQKILLYCEDNIKAAQGWFILKANNYKGVYILDGGVDSWKDEILFPSISTNASPEEKAEFDKIVEVSKFFGGSPQVSETDGEKEIKMPKIEMPAAIPMNTNSGKPKREGC